MTHDKNEKFSFKFENHPDSDDLIYLTYEGDKGSSGSVGELDYRRDLDKIMNWIDIRYEFDDFIGETENKKLFVEQFMDYFNNNKELNDRLNELKPISSRYINLEFRKKLFCKNGNLVIDKDEYPEIKDMGDFEVLEYLKSRHFSIKNKNGNIVDLFEQYNKPYDVIRWMTTYQVTLNGQKNMGGLPIEEYFDTLFNFCKTHNLIEDGLINFNISKGYYRITLRGKKEFINKGKSLEIYNDCMKYIRSYEMESEGNTKHKKKITDLDLVDNLTMYSDDVTNSFNMKNFWIR